MAAAITLLFCFLVFCCSTHALVSQGSSNATTEELALLSFKSMLGPSDSLASWNTSNHFCSWSGVVCRRGHPKRVIKLRLRSLNLLGQISPFLGNLSFLRRLDLSNNKLTGSITPDLGRLSMLRVLNLSINSLEGSIPATMGGCTQLRTLNLSNNHLHGQIPVEIGALKNIVNLILDRNGLSGEIPRSLTILPSIEALSLAQNNLYGEIPPALGNLSSLLHLLLHANKLTGAIPSSLGLLSRLSWLSLGANNLSGVIPTSVWNISSLKKFSVQRNMLSGTMPPNAFSKLPRLHTILMDHNKFHGYIPVSLANASDMSKFQLGANFFSGIVPPEVGRLGNLTHLVLPETLLEAKEPKDWKFITALTNCSQLKYLILTFCKFGGALPDSISNLSTSLIYLYLGANTISESIPKDIGNLVNLQIFALEDNYFTGALPSSFSRLNNLRILSVSNNKISGLIPSTIGNLTELNYLLIDGNTFSSRIPSTLGSLTKLLELNLSGNNLIGPIPRELFNITTLSLFLDLSHNNLEGSIPQEIGNLKNLIEFHAHTNKLSGLIPTTLGECQLLQIISLENNIFSGSIPSVLSQLKSLQTLDLSNNNLSGQIPKFLGNLSMLYYLNLSFNSFAGEVPIFGVFANATAISIQGNGKLCNGIPNLHLPSCSSQPKKKHKLLVIPIAICLVITLVILPLLYTFLTWHKKSNKSKIPSTTTMLGHPLISYSQLVRATDGFSTANLLGSGSFGSVYKAELDDQAGESTNLVAVKVLKLQTRGALKSFGAECEALRNLRHRNLVKIITACSSIDNRGNDFKAVVFDFMPNGSLESWLHLDTNEQIEQRYLNLLERVTILLDVAYALDYLHCHGPAPVVHCDVKSSNVLLDADMVAHVGDFGLARILVEGSSFFQQSTNSMGFRGTIGYAAPEYGAGNTVSTYGDIYSYGILVLETVTGKRPTDSKFRPGLSIREYVELGLHAGVLDVADIRLSFGLENELQIEDDSSYKKKIDCLISLLRIGLSCSQELPSSRMRTGDIIKELHATKESLERASRI